MNTRLAWLIAAILLVLLIYRENAYRSPHTDRQSLKQQNDSLLRRNAKLNRSVRHYKYRIDSLQKHKTNHEIHIQHLRQKKEKRLLALDSLNHNQLYRFFANFKAPDIAAP